MTCEWFPSTRAFFAMATDPDSRDVIRADEENFLDSDNLTWILTDAEEVIFDQPRSARRRSRAGQRTSSAMVRRVLASP